MIYLDNAATTLRKPECVKKAVYDAIETMGNSARGMHGFALDASRMIYETRQQAAEFFHAEDASNVAFTCNATEALNMAINGLVKPGNHVITTQTEHNSVLRPLYQREDAGTELTIVEADERGRITVESLENAIQKNTTVMVCSHASNVTGNLLPLEKIGQLCKKYGILFVVDVAQSAGVFPVDMKNMGIDVLCFTGHKGLMGAQGTGGICVMPHVKLRPFKTGGSGIHSFDREHPAIMPEMLEAGTLNGHGIAGLHAAFSYLQDVGIDTIRAHEQELTQAFYREVREIPRVKVYGDFESETRAAVVSLNIGGYNSKEMGDALWQEYGIAVRAGVHCAPLIHQALGTVEQGTVRFSFSWFNTREEVGKAVCAVRELAGE